MLQALLNVKEAEASLPPFARDAFARIKAYPIVCNGNANPPTVPSGRYLYLSRTGMFDHVDQQLLHCPEAQHSCIFAQWFGIVQKCWQGFNSIETKWMLK